MLTAEHMGNGGVMFVCRKKMSSPFTKASHEGHCQYYLRLLRRAKLALAFCEESLSFLKVFVELHNGG